MGEKVLVVGGGSREHAMAWCLARSPRVDEVLVAPGNAGTGSEPGCRNAAVKADDVAAIVELARSEQVGLVAVGPEDPLVAGLVDRLTDAGITAFGPSAAAAALEGSKSHCKEFLLRHGIPTAPASTFTDVDAALHYLGQLDEVPVVKADGLAAGKGVVVAESRGAAADAIRDSLIHRRFGSAGDEILLEERLTGPEVSVLAFCDGTDFHVMPAAQDHKRLLEGDHGPNTGGMGAFHPSPTEPGLLSRITREVIAPTVRAMADEGHPYRGVLYAGMILTTEGPKVIEFNCRFGDPETQVVLPLLQSDLLDIFEACASGSLAALPIAWSGQASVAVVMASAGYPTSAADPVPLDGIGTATAAGCVVFHGGTQEIGGVPHTAGGRVLAVTALGPDLASAAATAHAGVGMISFAGAQHRPDIALTSAGVPS